MPDLLDADTHRCFGQQQQFFIPENLLVLQLAQAFSRHAVHASQVAAVGDGKTQVVDLPAE
jgi:hypothetical protein